MLSGLSANCTLQPPSMPSARDDVQRRAAQHLVFLDRARVWQGATTMESPVCTPTGSKFSMLQTVMQLPVAIAHHLVFDFLPAGDAALDQDLMHAATVQAAPRRFRAAASRSSAMPPPAAAEGIGRAHDDRIADSLGKMQRRRQIVSDDSNSMQGSPMRSHRVFEEPRGPPRVRIVSALVPEQLARCASARMPFSSSSIARFRPVWPPSVGRRLSGRSLLDDLFDESPRSAVR